jgi:hypothetical protein
MLVIIRINTVAPIGKNLLVTKEDQSLHFYECEWLEDWIMYSWDIHN